MNREKQRRATASLPVMSVVLGMLVFCRCTFEEPAAPTWDVQFELPLISKLYTMEELTDEVDELTVENDTVFLDFDEEIETVEVGDQLRVDGASESFTVPVNGSRTDSLDIPADEVILTSATISSGNVYFIITNQGSQSVDVFLELTDLKDGFGNTFEYRVTVGGGVTDNETRILDGYVFTPPLYGGQNYIRYDVSLQNGDGDLDVTLDVSDLTFSSVSGILNLMEVEIDTMEAELDIPEELKDFELYSAELSLVLGLGLDFPAIADVMVTGLDDDGNILDSIPIHEEIPGGVATYTIKEDVADFINTHPEDIMITGTMTLGDGFTSGTITDDQKISGTANFRAPMVLTVPSYSSKMDVDTLDIDEDTQEIFRDNIKDAVLDIRIVNGLPIGMDFSILFSKTIGDTTIYDQTDDGVNTLRIDRSLDPAPISDSNPAVVTGTDVSNITIHLDENDLLFFSGNDQLFMGFLFDFRSTDPVNNPMLQFRPQDTIDIQGHISALVHTKIPEEDDDEEGGGS